MALWNQKHKENRRKIGKAVLTFLFICISISLLLFTYNNFFWSMLPTKNHVTSNTVVESDQETMAQHRLLLGTAQSSVTPTNTATVIASLPCVRIPPARTSPTVPTIARRQEGIYPVNRGKWRRPHPERTHARTKKRTVRATPTAKISVTPAPVSSSTATVTPTATVIATVTPTVTPLLTATASPVAPDTSGDVIATAAQDGSAAFTTFFAPGARIKGSISISNANKTDEIGEANGNSRGVGSLPVSCNSDDIEAAMSADAVMVMEQHTGWLLGSSLSGIILFFALVSAGRRKMGVFYYNS